MVDIIISVMNGCVQCYVLLHSNMVQEDKGLISSAPLHMKQDANPPV
jgi:hypothetical protein